MEEAAAAAEEAESPGMSVIAAESVAGAGVAGAAAAAAAGGGEGVNEVRAGCSCVGCSTPCIIARSTGTSGTERAARGGVAAAAEVDAAAAAV